MLLIFNCLFWNFRKRRLSDSQPLAIKRLTNGFTPRKKDHVTTRLQAKNDPNSRVSPTRKVKHKALTGEEKRLEISMRLRHEEKRSTKRTRNAGSSSCSGSTSGTSNGSNHSSTIRR